MTISWFYISEIFAFVGCHIRICGKSQSFKVTLYTVFKFPTQLKMENFVLNLKKSLNIFCG